MIYFHDRDYDFDTMQPKAQGGKTYAIEPHSGIFPVDESLESAFEIKMLTIGVSKCHPKDIFCKKTGRELAIIDAKPTPVELEGITKIKNNYFLSFSCKELGSLTIVIKIDRLGAVKGFRIFR